MGTMYFSRIELRNRNRFWKSSEDARWCHPITISCKWSSPDEISIKRFVGLDSSVDAELSGEPLRSEFDLRNDLRRLLISRQIKQLECLREEESRQLTSILQPGTILTDSEQKIIVYLGCSIDW